MSDDDTKVPLPDLENGGDVQVVPDGGTLVPSDSESVNRGAADLEAVFDVPVQVAAVLGRAHMEVGNLLKLGPGAVLELDRKGRRGNRHLRQQSTGRTRRSRSCGRQARRDHDRNHQGGSQLMLSSIRHFS
jgi:hypothetical protein